MAANVGASGDTILDPLFESFLQNINDECSGATQSESADEPYRSVDEMATRMLEGIVSTSALTDI